MNLWDLAKTAYLAHFSRGQTVIAFEDLYEEYQNQWLRVATAVKNKLEEENNDF